ncbi:MAG: helix-turn-helix transcriptional regulator [Candidatus Levyibacteriota bacterium]
MTKSKLMPFSEFKRKALKDPEIKRHYDALELEFSIIAQVIQKRLDKGLSQKQLAEKVGTKQSAISRLEGGNIKPSIAFLEKIAKALDSKLQVSLQKQEAY